MDWENKKYHIEERLRALAMDREAYELRVRLNETSLAYTKDRIEHYEAKLKALEESKES